MLVLHCLNLVTFLDFLEIFTCFSVPSWILNNCSYHISNHWVNIVFHSFILVLLILFLPTWIEFLLLLVVLRICMNQVSWPRATIMMDLCHHSYFEFASQSLTIPIYNSVILTLHIPFSSFQSLVQMMKSSNISV